MNRTYLILLLILVGGVVHAQKKINWMTMDQALAAQQENPKKILMDVYTDWCGPCKLMDRETFSNKKVIKFINKNYYPVKFNAEGPDPINYQGEFYDNPGYKKERTGRNTTHDFSIALNIEGYPSLVFFTEEGELIESIPGYRSPKDVEIYLKMIANDDYKDLTTLAKWEAYKASFKGTF